MFFVQLEKIRLLNLKERKSYERKWNSFTTNITRKITPKSASQSVISINHTIVFLLDRLEISHQFGVGEVEREGGGQDTLDLWLIVH